MLIINNILATSEPEEHGEELVSLNDTSKLAADIGGQRLRTLTLSLCTI